MHRAPKPNSLWPLQKKFADPWSREIVHVNWDSKPLVEKVYWTKNSCYYHQNILFKKKLIVEYWVILVTDRYKRENGKQWKKHARYLFLKYIFLFFSLRWKKDGMKPLVTTKREMSLHFYSCLTTTSTTVRDGKRHGLGSVGTKI